jgi:hypothetical protein
MQTDPSTPEAQKDRDIFSHQTLLLTALTALNNPNHNPTLNDRIVNEERLACMKQKTNHHTRVTDAAATILITDTEILATTSMTQEVYTIVAIKEDSEDGNRRLQDAIKAGLEPQSLEISNEFIDSEDIAREKPDPSHKKTVFFPFPSINKKLLKSSKALSPIGSSSTGGSHDHICQPIVVDKGFWDQILNSETGFMVESKK